MEVCSSDHDEIIYETAECSLCRSLGDRDDLYAEYVEIEKELNDIIDAAKEICPEAFV